MEEAESAGTWFADIRSLGVKDGPLNRLKNSMEELARESKPLDYVADVDAKGQQRIGGTSGTAAPGPSYFSYPTPDQPPKAYLCFDAGCQYLSSLGAVPPIYNVGLAPSIALDLSLFYILGIPVV